MQCFRREADYWTITYEGRVTRLKDTKGMSYIARLLGHPDDEFHSLDLIGGGQTLGIKPHTPKDSAMLVRCLIQRPKLTTSNR